MTTVKKILLKLAGPLLAVVLFLGTLYLLLFSFDKQETKKIVKASQGLEKKMSIYSDVQVFHKYRVFGAAPGSDLNFKLTYNGKLIYDQIYHTNEVLMRVPLAGKSKKKHHVIFGGCSFTWGEGMKPEETFPWIFQSNFKNVNAYNLGFPGGGLHLHLKYHSIFDYRKVIKEESGYFIYTFFPDQLDRFFARYNYLSWADGSYPHYEVENGRPVDKGEIKDQEVWKKFMLFRKSGIEKFAMKTQNTDEWSEKEINDFALSIKELARLYNDKFPKGEFIFIIHPKDNFPDRARLTKFLTRLNIKVLEPLTDFENLMISQNKTVLHFQIPQDSHPNQAFNRFFGQWIADKLKREDRNLI